MAAAGGGGAFSEIDTSITTTWTSVALPALEEAKRQIGVAELPTKTHTVDKALYDFRVHRSWSDWRYIFSLNVPRNCTDVGHFLANFKIFFDKTKTVMLPEDSKPWNMVDSIDKIRIVIDYIDDDVSPEGGFTLADSDVADFRKDRDARLQDTDTEALATRFEWMKSFPWFTLTETQTMRVFFFGNGTRHVTKLLEDFGGVESLIRMELNAHDHIDKSYCQVVPFRFTCMQGFNVFYFEPDNGLRASTSTAASFGRAEVEVAADDDEPELEFDEFESGSFEHEVPEGPVGAAAGSEGPEGPEYPPGTHIIQVPMAFLKQDGTMKAVGIEVAQALFETVNKASERQKYIEAFGRSLRENNLGHEEYVQRVRAGIHAQFMDAVKEFRKPKPATPTTSIIELAADVNLA